MFRTRDIQLTDWETWEGGGKIKENIKTERLMELFRDITYSDLIFSKQFPVTIKISEKTSGWDWYLETEIFSCLPQISLREYLGEDESSCSI